MDGNKALIAFANAGGIEYELIIASKGEHVHEGVLPIQNVNAYGRRFKQQLDRFNGATAKPAAHSPALSANGCLYQPPKVSAALAPAPRRRGPMFPQDSALLLRGFPLSRE